MFANSTIVVFGALWVNCFDDLGSAFPRFKSTFLFIDSPMWVRTCGLPMTV